VRDARGSDALDQLTGRIAHIVEQRLAGAEGDRDDVQVELVEQLGREVLRGSRPLRRRELDCARGAPPQRDGDVARAANLLARPAEHRADAATMASQFCAVVAPDSQSIGRI
jgi:hypothetical protein